MDTNLWLLGHPNVKLIETENSGGGNMLTFVTLTNDQVLVISDKYVGLYESKNDFYEGDRQIIVFHLAEEI